MCFGCSTKALVAGDPEEVSNVVRARSAARGPQPEAGAGELLTPTIRPSGLKFALKTAVFHTGYSYPV
ncbi:MAG: hypothetical protein CM1200mP30_10870 [Pseudomonadota bacterium]|nr:MAG: hypothetical protein CM1200mP30_10870 [Pseudomonadota bacterium]